MQCRGHRGVEDKSLGQAARLAGAKDLLSAVGSFKIFGLES